MSFTSRLVLGLASGAIAATAALAASMHEDRVTTMKAQGAQLGILAGMAQEKAPYDAATATAAATELASIVAWDPATLFPAGDTEGRVLPAVYENFADFTAKHEALVTAANALAADAGNGLDALKAAMGPVGGACGGCHQTYRAAQ